MSYVLALALGAFLGVLYVGVIIYFLRNFRP
jgi:hypothetical protein